MNAPCPFAWSKRWSNWNVTMVELVGFPSFSESTVHVMSNGGLLTTCLKLMSKLDSSGATSWKSPRIARNDSSFPHTSRSSSTPNLCALLIPQIGRASCRERGEISEHVVGYPHVDE